jgi:hypothetical protein
MTIWKVYKYYDRKDNIYYMMLPYDLKGHLLCCFKWYGLKGLKWCYLSKKQAERKIAKLEKVK